jgi:hypothetical protein
MNVDDAVLKLFADLNVPAGGRLSYATLVKEWPRMHLRHADLAESVQRLARLTFLETQHSAGGHYVILTAGGHGRALELIANRLPGQIHRLRMGALRFVRSLLAGASEPDRRRRLRDRVAPQV